MTLLKSMISIKVFYARYLFLEYFCSVYGFLWPTMSANFPLIIMSIMWLITLL